MKIEVNNEELAKAIYNLADQEGMDVNAYCEDLFAFHLDHGIATMAMRRIENTLVDDILPALQNSQVNGYAVRHQIVNLHADILNDPNRAIDISDQGTEVGNSAVFDESFGDEGN